MKLEDYLDTLNIDLEITRYCNQEERWSARFDGCEIKIGGCLRSAFGNGHSPDEAIASYIREIRGQRIVFNAYDEKRRREYTVPEGLADSIAPSSTGGAR